MNPRPDHGETSYVGWGRLAGRKALITGGDSGMGRAAAIAFAREGADVAINYLPAEEPDAREVVALIRDVGRRAVAIPGDLRDEAFCRRLVDEAVGGLGGLDIVVCNAGRQQSHGSILDPCATTAGPRTMTPQLLCQRSTLLAIGPMRGSLVFEPGDAPRRSSRRRAAQTTALIYCPSATSLKSSPRLDIGSTS